MITLSSEWDLVQFVTSMAAHRAGSPRNSKTPDALCFVEDLEQNRDCLDLDNPLGLVQSQDLPTLQSQDLSVGSQQELPEQVHLSGSSDLFHLGLLDSQDVLDRLAERHFIEYESDSEGGGEEGEVIEACLRISLFSPKPTRTVQESQTHREENPPQIEIGCLIGEPPALSPLTLLSRKLGERLAAEQREACTQTSQVSLSRRSPTSTSTKSSPVSPSPPTSSPSVASSGLPSLSPCTPAPGRPLPAPTSAQSPETPPLESTSHEVSSPEAVSTSLETTRDSYTTTSSSQEEAGPRDSLQDIIFDEEETTKVRQREVERQQRELERQQRELERQEDCKECREKQRQRHCVRFNLDELEEQKKKEKKVNLCAAFMISLQKLIVKFKSKLRK